MPTEAQFLALATLEMESRQVAAHPWYAIQQGYVLTEDEKRGGTTSPMPAYPYLRILCELFMQYPIGMMLKSRQMMASWLFCWVVLWTAKFRSGSLSLMQGKRLDDVKAIGTKSLMGRMMFIHRNLPDFMKGAGEIASEGANRKQRRETPGLKGAETLTSLVVPGGGVVIAAPQGPDVIRSKTATTVIMDELPHHPEGLEAWTAALPTVDGADQDVSEARLWGIGTPNGRDPLCFGMAPWEDWRRWKELTGFKYEGGGDVEGLRIYLKERVHDGYRLPPICCVRLHYTAEYNPGSWARRRATKAAYPSAGAYEREHELSFRTVAGMPVYGEEAFTPAHVATWKPDPLRGVFISMDLGFMGTAACLWQIQGVRFAGRVYNRHRLWWARIWKGVPLGDVLDELKELLTEKQFDWRSATWIADWNSLNTHHGGAGVTDFQVYDRNGINPIARPVGPHQVDQGLNLVRLALKPLPDGSPGMMVDPDNAVVAVEALEGGYRYESPPAGKPMAYTETPAKDGVYDHVCDAIRYRYWIDPDCIFEPDEVLEMDKAMPGTSEYVREYLHRKKYAHDRDPNVLGPSGGLAE